MVICKMIPEVHNGFFRRTYKKFIKALCRFKRLVANKTVVLAHKMAHQYQFERYGCAILHTKRDWMKKDADKHARNIVKL